MIDAGLDGRNDADNEKGGLERFQRQKMRTDRSG